MCAINTHGFMCHTHLGGLGGAGCVLLLLSMMCGTVSGVDEEVRGCGGEEVELGGEVWVGDMEISSPEELALLMPAVGGVFFLEMAGGGGRLNLGTRGLEAAGLACLDPLLPWSSCLSSFTRTESSSSSSSSSWRLRF